MVADGRSLGNREHVNSLSLAPLSLPTEDVAAYGEGEGVYTDRVASEHVETFDSVPGELAA